LTEKSKQKSNSALPELGQRGLIIGQTGSGKTNFAIHLLKNLTFVPFVIYDTKDEEKFLTLPKSILVHDEQSRNDALNNDEQFDFVIVRPPANISNDDQAMDEMLQSHYNELHGVGAYVDEIYSFHSGNGRAGKGLLSLLTRGRSRGITTIMSTQRPAWISKFCYSEAQKLFVFLLMHEDDRKHVAKFIPNFDIDTFPPKHGFWQYSQGDNNPQLFLPVPLAKFSKQEYNGEPLTEQIGIERLKNKPIKEVKWI